MWAKLEAMAEGARIASEHLWKNPGLAFSSSVARNPIWFSE
jgi:hypothetical protein